MRFEKALNTGSGRETGFKSVDRCFQAMPGNQRAKISKNRENDSDQEIGRRERLRVEELAAESRYRHMVEVKSVGNPPDVSEDRVFE